LGQREKTGELAVELDEDVEEGRERLEVVWRKGLSSRSIEKSAPGPGQYIAFR